MASLISEACRRCCKRRGSRRHDARLQRVAWALRADRPVSTHRNARRLETDWAHAFAYVRRRAEPPTRVRAGDRIRFAAIDRAEFGRLESACTINVTKPGLFTTVQDLGRYRFAHLGISPAGAADASVTAYRQPSGGQRRKRSRVGDDVAGRDAYVRGAATIAITGAHCECKLGSDTVPINQAVEVPSGSVLQCGSTTNGARCYLAVQGGLDVPW